MIPSETAFPLRNVLLLKAFMIFLLTFCTFFYSACAQELSFEIATGASGGWWYYSQGAVDNAFDTGKGNAYSESTLMVPLETNIRYTLHRFDVGLGINYTLFVEDDMYGVGNQDATLNTIKISEGAVTFLKVHLLSSFALLQRERYTLSPQIKTGLFNIHTTHPEKDNFGTKTFWETGFMNEISFTKWSLILYPHFNTMNIHTREPVHTGENHKIYSLGIMFGTRWLLYTQ